MEDKFKTLKTRLGEISDFNAACSLLSWDQQTFMPPRSADSRGKQMATLQKTAHERFISDEIGRLLDDLSGWAGDKGYESDEASLIRVVKQDYDKARRVPSELVAEFAEVTTLAMEVWAGARKESDFPKFRPFLEKVVDLNRRLAEALGYKESIYDPLLDQFEPGMKKSDIAAIFEDLKNGLKPIVREISLRKGALGKEVLHQDFDEDKQLEIASDIVKTLGYDFERGRLDKSAHPFSTSFSMDDVRITTRVYKNYLPSCLFACIHECGHALYEQGMGRSLERTPLCQGTSLGMHESQSRLWENLVGRSRSFCVFCLPRLKKAFPQQFASVDVEDFYKAINKSGPSLIRVEADEVTYNMHIFLRFEMEIDLLEGKLEARHAPEAWNAKMESCLGIVPRKDSEGILQDVHWSMGSMGYFPTYSLGNVASVQIFNQAQKDIPGLPGRIETGQFAELLEWLREKIHRHGKKFTLNEVLKRVTGSELQSAPYLEYIRKKFGGIYNF